MAIILEPERRSGKARFVLGLIYAALTLGAATMVYPFAVMISASMSSAYDYNRHDVATRALFSESDRFVRSVATIFPVFPREVYEDAPEEWTTWQTVAADASGVKEFASRQLAPYREPSALAAGIARADAYLARLSADANLATSCRVDPRDIPAFVQGKYKTLDALNAAWPVPHKSFFDVSFTAEARESPNAPDDAKRETWNEMKRMYLARAASRGDHISRTIPKTISPEDAAELRNALAVQFLDHGWRDFFRDAFANYALVGQYLFLRGRAFANTLILVLLSLIASLTVNPLAAYALSRFHLRSTEKIILFLLATTAFPAAVTAIPGFLLIRDLGLLNTFAALVLPGVASGMSIFILKGFFDALPRELYEAAAIDGAGEWTVFTRITLPMTTPILAVNALNSFIHAYSSWEWAFLVCQKESHWTLAVWMYQMSQTFSHPPWCVMAAFVLVSIPTAVVFLACQKVILRGIVLPSMK